MRRPFIPSLFLVLGLLLAPVAHAASVPEIISGACREMDRQMATRLQQESPVQGVSVILTTPVNIDALNESNTLARQVQEEMARWFTQAGYSVQEIRKGASLTFEPTTGELLLTRDLDCLASTSPSAVTVAVGTYTVTARNIRYNLRLVQLASQEVLAMSTVSVPITNEIAGLVGKEAAGGTPIEPTVVTRLP
jgi:hypothetical protein